MVCPPPLCKHPFCVTDLYILPVVYEIRKKMRQKKAKCDMVLPKHLPKPQLLPQCWHIECLPRGRGGESHLNDDSSAISSTNPKIHVGNEWKRFFPEPDEVFNWLVRGFLGLALGVLAKWRMGKLSFLVLQGEGMGTKGMKTSYTLNYLFIFPRRDQQVGAKKHDEIGKPMKMVLILWFCTQFRKAFDLLDLLYFAKECRVPTPSPSWSRCESGQALLRKKNPWL